MRKRSRIDAFFDRLPQRRALGGTPTKTLNPPTDPIGVSTMRNLALPVLTIMLSGRMAAAQTHADTVQIIATAAKHAMAADPGRRFVVDTSDHQIHGAGVRAPGGRRSTNAAVRKALPSVKHGRQEDFLSCQGDHCAWSEGDEILNFGVPSITGDTALISVEITHRMESARRPTAYYGATYVIVRKGGKWRFADVGARRTS